MLINNWRQSWRLWSVRVCAAAAALYAFMLAAPDQALLIWQSLPLEVQALVPNRTKVAATLFMAVAIARLLRQQPAISPSLAWDTVSGDGRPALKLTGDLGIAGDLTVSGTASPDGGASPVMSMMAPLSPWRIAALAPISRAITSIAVHCTATREGQPFHAADIRVWHKKQGWDDIGYHFVVLLDGSIELGRPKDKVGAHVGGHNATSIGIVYVGGVAGDGRTPKDTRTTAQKAAMLDLLRALRTAHPKAIIQGHRDYPKVAKACPSFDAKTEYAGLAAAS